MKSVITSRFLAGALADLLDRCGRSSKNRRHSSGARSAGFVHQLAAPPYELRGSRKTDGIGGVICGEFTQGMSRGCADVLVQRVLRQRPNGGAVRKESRLRIACRSQLVRRPFEAKATQVQSERGVDLTKDSSRDRECLGQIFSHSRLL